MVLRRLSLASLPLALMAATAAGQDAEPYRFEKPRVVHLRFAGLSPASNKYVPATPEVAKGAFLAVNPRTEIPAATERLTGSDGYWRVTPRPDGTLTLRSLAGGQALGKYLGVDRRSGELGLVDGGTGTRWQAEAVPEQPNVLRLRFAGDDRDRDRYLQVQPRTGEVSLTPLPPTEEERNIVTRGTDFIAEAKESEDVGQDRMRATRWRVKVVR